MFAALYTYINTDKNVQNTHLQITTATNADLRRQHSFFYHYFVTPYIFLHLTTMYGCTYERGGWVGTVCALLMWMSFGSFSLWEPNMQPLCIWRKVLCGSFLCAIKLCTFWGIPSFIQSSISVFAAAKRAFAATKPFSCCNFRIVAKDLPGQRPNINLPCCHKPACFSLMFSFVSNQTASSLLRCAIPSVDTGRYTVYEPECASTIIWGCGI